LELLPDLVTGEGTVLVLLAPGFPFPQTSPVLVREASEAPVLSTLCLLTNAFDTRSSHSLPSRLLSSPGNLYWPMSIWDTHNWAFLSPGVYFFGL